MTACNNMHFQWLLFLFVLIAMAIMQVSSVDAFDGKYKSRHKHHRHGHHGGKNFLGISPYGITYGYYGKDIGIEIGPLFGKGFGHHSYYDVTPNYVPHYQAPYPGPPVYGSTYGYSDYGPESSILPAAPSAATPQPNRSDRSTVIPTNQNASSYQIEAEQAFRQQRYDQALRLARHTSVEDGDNGFVFLFGSQAAFAVAQYQSAYAALESAIDMLDQNQWGFVVKNYHRLYTGDDYVSQMEALVQYADANPNVSYPLTLRGYHYAFLGYPDDARKHFKKALELNANDEVARKLLAGLGEELPAPAPVPTDKTQPPRAADLNAPR